MPHQRAGRNPQKSESGKAAGINQWGIYRVKCRGSSCRCLDHRTSKDIHRSMDKWCTGATISQELASHPSILLARRAMTSRRGQQHLPASSCQWSQSVTPAPSKCICTKKSIPCSFGTPRQERYQAQQPVKPREPRRGESVLISTTRTSPHHRTPTKYAATTCSASEECPASAVE